MKFNHDAEKVGSIIEDHTPDEERIQDLIQDMFDTPKDIFGEKKSHTAQYIHENANDPDVVIALAYVMVQGVAAFNSMARLEAETKAAMAQMDIHPDMPLEMKKAIRQAKAEAIVPQEPEVLEETDDEFEKLKQRHVQ